MYCNNCGKHNSHDSEFCKYCGAKITRVHLTDSSPQNHTNPNTSVQTKELEGLNGWLALVGVGLILIPIIQGYGLLEYFPLFEQSYEIPGYMTLLIMEFVATILIILTSCYLIYLYLKKKSKFPHYYIIFLSCITLYTIVDYILLATLIAPYPEQQQVIDDIVSESTSEVGRSLLTSIIWILYMSMSKRVKATFVNN